MVTADGFLPLPAHARPELPPGTLVRFQPVDGGFRLVVEGRPERRSGGGS